MNRELFISLGITILITAALFLYFRHKFKVVEHKVNTIFQLVQSHARPARPARPATPRQQMMRTPMPENRVMGEAPLQTAPIGTDINNLIDVSDDDYSDSGDETDDSDSESDAGGGKISLGGDIKQISVLLGTEENAPTEINLEEKKSELDEISQLSEDEAEEEEVADTPSHEEIPDYAKMTVAQLKEIASAKGFNNFRKLRKQGLVDLLSN